MSNIKTGQIIKKLAKTDPKVKRFIETLGIVAPAAEAVSRKWAAISKTERRKMDKATRELLAESKIEWEAELRKNEKEWQDKTGITPPRWRTIEELEQAIAWWQEKAAEAGINPDIVLQADESVMRFAPVIKGTLHLRRLQSATLKAVDSGGDNRKLKDCSIVRLRELTGLSTKTLNRYGKKASIQTPGKGERTFIFSGEDTYRLLNTIIDKSSEKLVIDRCMKALEQLKTPGEIGVETDK